MSLERERERGGERERREETEGGKEREGGGRERAREREVEGGGVEPHWRASRTWSLEVMMNIDFDSRHVWHGSTSRHTEAQQTLKLWCTISVRSIFPTINPLTIFIFLLFFSLFLRRRERTEREREEKKKKKKRRRKHTGLAALNWWWTVITIADVNDMPEHHALRALYTRYTIPARSVALNY